MHEKDKTNEAELEHFQTWWMFFLKQLKVSNFWPFSQKGSIKDIWDGSKYASEVLW